MGRRTYYDILGISRDAAPEEITGAKNALAKVYHPDVNIKNNVDTTSYMQEILEAYQVLSDPVKREKYDMKLSGGRRHAFRTYTATPPEKDEPVSFVSYWNAAYKLNAIVEKSGELFRKNPRANALTEKISKISGRQTKSQAMAQKKLKALSVAAISYITILESAKIPADYWNPDAMNWVLVRWGAGQSADYHVLFSKYDVFIENNKTRAEKIRLKSKSRHFQKGLKMLLEYSI